MSKSPAILSDLASFVSLFVRQRVLSVWLRIPFGKICSFPWGSSNQMVTVRKNFMIEVSDGQSIDALPIGLVSEDLIREIIRVMSRMGYPMATEAPRSHQDARALKRVRFEAQSTCCSGASGMQKATVKCA